MKKRMMKKMDINIYKTVGSINVRDNKGVLLYVYNAYSNPKLQEDLKPEKVIFNPPTTICYFKDGTKEIIRMSQNEILAGTNFDPEVGVAMAIVRHLYKNRLEFLRLVEKGYWQPPKE